MSNYHTIFDKHLTKVKNEGRYREFVSIKRQADNFPLAWNNDSQIVMWCINDYLGMSKHPAVIKASLEALDEFGLGSGGTRNIGGNNSKIIELESELASLHNKESALVFTSGYVANDTTLATLSKIIPDLIFFSDELNHASIIAGISHSKAEKHIYRHIDVTHLEELLKSVNINQPKIIVFESAYSMDGLFSPIKDIIKLAKQYNALTFIDEVHTVGLYGKHGAGIAEMQGCGDNIDIIQGTLGKAYGAIGGYITAKQQIIDSIRSSAPGFIFTTSLPPIIAAGAIASIKHLKESKLERETHQEVIKKVKQSFDQAKIRYFKNDGYIIPIIIGDALKAKEASQMLLNKYGIYIQHINFPTVKRGTERLRIIPTPNHTDKMIKHLTNSLVEVFRALNIVIVDASPQLPLEPAA